MVKIQTPCLKITSYFWFSVRVTQKKTQTQDTQAGDGTKCELYEQKAEIWGPNPENSKTQKSKATNRVETDEQTGEPTGGSEEKTHASTHLEGLTDETQV